jgi:hypothetical protein
MYRTKVDVCVGLRHRHEAGTKHSVRLICEFGRTVLGCLQGTRQPCHWEGFRQLWTKAALGDHSIGQRRRDATVRVRTNLHTVPDTAVRSTAPHEEVRDERCSCA